jgi:hypothetical protein
MPQSMTGFCPVRRNNFFSWLFGNTTLQIEVSEKNRIVKTTSYNLRPRRKQISYAEESESEREA